MSLIAVVANSISGIHAFLLEVLDCLRVLWLPLDADQRWQKEEILSGGEIKTIIEAVYGPLELVPDDPSETARCYTFTDAIGEVGFIHPVSEPFCATRDRIRPTAYGQLRTCLFATTETDPRAVLRSGGDDERVA